MNAELFLCAAGADHTNKHYKKTNIITALVGYCKATKTINCDLDR